MERLKQLKLSKVTELLSKKTLELEELCRKAHLLYDAPNAKTCQVEDMVSCKNYVINFAVTVMNSIIRRDQDSFYWLILS